LRRFESFSLTSDGHTSASFVLDSQAKLRSGRARVLGYLGSVDSGESSEEVVLLFIYGLSVRELGRIGCLGVSGRWSAAKMAAPYHSRQSRPAEASPELYYVTFDVN
jgi:hypothetical protein